MSLDTYANFQTAIADQLARSDLTTQIVDCITLFEAEASYELFRTRGKETLAILVPSNPAALTVSNAANNGSGLIRLTVSSTSTLSTGQEVGVTGIVGTTEANTSWIITVIDGSNIDLQGSTFTNAYTSGGTVQALFGTVTLPTDYLSWRRATWMGSPSTELEYVHPDTIHGYYPTLPAGTPRYFTIEGTTLTIVPHQAGNIEFDYYAKTPALSGNLNWLFTNRVDCYWNGVLEQVYSYLKDYEQAQVYQTKKLASYESILRQRFVEGTGLTIRVMGPMP